MKIIFSLALLSLLTAQSAHADSIIRKNFFSYVIACKDQRPALLDFLEASMLRQQNVSQDILALNTESEVTDYLSRSFFKFSPLRNKEFIEEYYELKKNLQISEGIKITPPPEKDNLIQIPECELLPVATLMQTIDTYEDKVSSKVLIDKSIWDKLSLTEQVAVILDFSMMKNYDQKDLISARLFTGYWFSDSFKTFSDKDWFDFIKHLEFPYFEFAGFKLILKDERYYHPNGMLARLDFYKKNDVRIHGQELKTWGYGRLYPNGRLENLGSTSDYAYKLPSGSVLNLGGGWDYPMAFFDDEKSSIASANIARNEDVIKYASHELKFDNSGSFFSKVSFYPKGQIKDIVVMGADVKIRDKVYKLTAYPADGSYRVNSKIEFYDNGEIKCAESFLKGQTFLTEKKKSYKTNFIEKLCFNQDGLVQGK